jgi:hypothetical protein
LWRSLRFILLKSPHFDGPVPVIVGVSGEKEVVEATLLTSTVIAVIVAAVVDFWTAQRKDTLQ